MSNATPTFSPPLSAAPPAADAMRSLAWELGELRAGEQYLPPANHCALAFVNPRQAYVHYRMLASWIDLTAREKGGAWHNCRMIVRVYDTSDIVFTGFNAHQVLNIAVHHIAGHAFITLPRGGRTWMAEVGFELRNREFIAAARSQFVFGPVDGPSPRTDHAALFVGENFTVEEAGSIWEQGAFLAEKKRPKLQAALKIVHFAMEAAALGDAGQTATFVSELAAAQAAVGHDVHVLLPRREGVHSVHSVSGVAYHPLDIDVSPDPLETARRYANASQAALGANPCDLVHCHEWITAQGDILAGRASILSLSSLEATRLNGAPPTELSNAIAAHEKESAAKAGLVLMPDWLRPRAISEAGFALEKTIGFPMEGREADEWTAGIDVGKVKIEMGFGPLDRVLIYIGPLEYDAGVDVLIDAMPTALHRANNLRVAIVGTGSMFDALSAKAHHVGAGHAVKLLGDVRGEGVVRFLRASLALVLPSRKRVEFDESVVDMARRAALPVITTHAGPAHRVKHEETGIITYDNPNSMVWALDRILGDAAHAQRMGEKGRVEGGTRQVSWAEIARRYFAVCIDRFPSLIKDATGRG